MKLKVTVDNKLYEIDVEVSDPKLEGPTYYPPLHARMPASPPPARQTSTAPSEEAGDESKVCRSPLAGTVTRVNAQVGQTIHEGDVLLVLEAMKMETVITAPFSGKIKVVNAEVGNSVAQRQVLVEIE